MTRNNRLRFRVTAKEKIALDSLAKSYGISTSELLRRMLNEVIVRGTSFFPDQSIAIQANTKELKAIGQELNLVARRVNSGECVEDPLSKEQLNRLKSAVVVTKGIANTLLMNAATRRKVLRKAARKKGYWG